MSDAASEKMTKAIKELTAAQKDFTKVIAAINENLNILGRLIQPQGEVLGFKTPRGLFSPDDVTVVRALLKDECASCKNQIERSALCADCRGHG